MQHTSNQVWLVCIEETPTKCKNINNSLTTSALCIIIPVLEVTIEQPRTNNTKTKSPNKWEREISSDYLKSKLGFYVPFHGQGHIGTDPQHCHLWE